MTKKLSFTAIEKELSHEFRNHINHAEDSIDLENHFSFTMVKLVEKSINNGLQVNTDDIVFSSGAENHYIMSSKLKQNPKMKEIMNNSDLPRIIKNFADSTYNRYVHLRKNPSKTEAKIRN